MPRPLYRYKTDRPELFDGGLPGGKARELAAEELGDGLVREPGELRELLGWTQPHLRRGPAARLAVHAEHHLRRVVYNARLRLPRSEPLPRF